MKLTRLLIFLGFMSTLLVVSPGNSLAADHDWGAGIGYDFRDGDHFRNGLAFKLDRRTIVLPALSVHVQAGVSAHFLTRRFAGYSGDFSSINVTLGPLVRITTLPLITPYAGFAGGVEFYEERYSASAPAEVPDYENQRALFFGSGGIEFDLLDNAKPFVEVRYYGFESVAQIPDDAFRLGAGVMVRF